MTWFAKVTHLTRFKCKLHESNQFNHTSLLITVYTFTRHFFYIILEEERYNCRFSQDIYDSIFDFILLLSRADRDYGLLLQKLAQVKGGEKKRKIKNGKKNQTHEITNCQKKKYI
jgi:hypothetical protein